MPEERDIEKALRAWTKRRREDAGAPLDLHPATRKLFQAEVARLKGGRHRSPGRLAGILWGTPLRLVLNSSVVVLLVAAALLLPQLRPTHANQTKLAQNNFKSDGFGVRPPTTSDKVAMNAPAPPVEPERNLLERSTTNATLYDNYASSASDSLSRKTPAAPPLPTAAPASLDLQNRPPAETVVPGAVSDTGKMQLANSVTAGATLASVSGAAVGVISNTSWVNQSTNSDRSLRVAGRRGVQAPLGSFRTEQTGDQLRVIDADGSVYTGNLAMGDTPLTADGYFTIPQTGSFRVTGTNLTLKQPVDFAGSFVDQRFFSGATTAAKSNYDYVVGGGIGGGGFGGGGSSGGFGSNRAASQTTLPHAPVAAARPAVPAAQPIPLAPTVRLQGRAIIGTNEIQIDAVPTAP